MEHRWTLRRRTNGRSPRHICNDRWILSFKPANRDALRRHHDVSFETVALGYRTATAAFNTVWHDLHVTWTIRERLAVVLEGLGLELPDEMPNTADL